MKQVHALSLDEALAALADLAAVVTLAEAAAALGVAEITLRRRIAAGELRAIKTRPGHGGRLRIFKRDIALLLLAMNGAGART